MVPSDVKPLVENATARQNHFTSAVDELRSQGYLAAAAVDLQSVLTRITGIASTWPIQYFAPGTSPTSGIVLATVNRISRAGYAGTKYQIDPALQISADGQDGPEAFYIVADQARLTILGNRGEGVSHGVQHLLESFGYRQYFMSRAWEIVPSMQNVSTQLHVSDRPAFVAREFPAMGNDARFATPFSAEDAYYWWRRQRAGYSVFNKPNHSWHLFISAYHQTLHDHPSWILGGDKGKWGDVTDPAFPPGNAIPDVSIPEVRALMLEFFTDQVRQRVAAAGSQTRIGISIDPADGEVWYLDDVDNPDWYRQIGNSAPGWQGTISDHVFGFVNWAVQQMAPQFPGKEIYVSLLGYNYHDKAPNFAVDPRVYVYVAEGFNKSLGTTFESLLDEWRPKVGARLGVYGYFSQPLSSRGLPPGAPTSADEVANRYRNFYEKGARYRMAESATDMGPNGLAYHLAHRAAWNPYRDLAADRADFLNKAFGQGAAEMGAYYETLDPNQNLATRNTFGKAIGHLSNADAQVRAAGNLAAAARIKELKYWWYYQYLYGNILANATDQDYRKLLRDFLFFQGPSYSTSWYLLKDILGWGDFPARMWNGSIETTCLTAAEIAKPCTQPEWTQYGYTDAQVDAWWPLVRAYFPYQPVTTTNFSFDLVPVRELASKPSNADAGQGVYGESSAQAWTYSYAGEPIVYKVHDIYAPYQEQVSYSYVLYNQNGQEVARQSETTVSRRQPLIIKHNVLQPGAYRLALKVGAGTYAIKPAPGYPLSFGYGIREAQGYPYFGIGPVSFYVPKATTQVVGDMVLQGTVGKAQVVRPSGSSLIAGIQGYPGFVGGLQQWPVATADRGAAWQIVNTYPKLLHFHSVPNVISFADNALMVPRTVAQQDGLTIEATPTVERIMLFSEHEAASKFNGEYEQVITGPALRPHHLPVFSANWATLQAWKNYNGQTNYAIVYRSRSTPSIYIVRAAASRPFNDGTPIVPELGFAGYFAVFNELDDASQPWLIGRTTSTARLSTPQLPVTWSVVKGSLRQDRSNETAITERVVKPLGFDLVPVTNFDVAKTALKPDNGVGVYGPSTVQAWTYSFAGESVHYLIHEIYQPTQATVDYSYTLFDSEGGRVHGAAVTAAPKRTPIVLSVPVPRAGAYRLELKMNSVAFTVNPHPGYPLSFGFSGKEKFSFPHWALANVSFYVPKKDPLQPARDLTEVWSETVLSSGTQLKVPTQGMTSYQPVNINNPASFRTVAMPSHPHIANTAGGARIWTPALAEKGAPWMFTSGTTQAVQFFNIPNVISYSGSLLMVPRQVATSDGLTIATQRGAIDGFVLQVSDAALAKFGGEYRQVIAGPALKDQYLPVDASNWASLAAIVNYYGPTDYRVVFQHKLRPTVYLMRTVASPYDSNRQMVVPQLGPAGYFVAFDNTDVATASWIYGKTQDGRRVTSNPNVTWYRSNGAFRSDGANQTSTAVTVTPIP